MQNQILGFFIITCVCLGVLCGAQWRQLREKRAETDHLKDELADQALELDGKAAALETLKRERQRSEEQLDGATASIRVLEVATNSLGRQLARANRFAVDMNGEEVGPLGTLLGGLQRDPALVDRLLVEEARAQLEGTDHPLSKEQVTELLDLLSEERQQASADPATAQAARVSGWVLEPEAIQERIRRQEAFNQRVLGLARDLLLADQLQALARAQTNVLQLQQYGFDWGHKRYGEQTNEIEKPEPAGPDAQPLP